MCHSSPKYYILSRLAIIIKSHLEKSTCHENGLVKKAVKLFPHEDEVGVGHMVRWIL